MRFITIKVFSKETGLPDKSIRAGIQRGELRASIFGKRWMIDFDAFQEGLSEKAPILANPIRTTRSSVKAVSLKDYIERERKHN